MYVSLENDKINVLSPKLWVSILLYTAFWKHSKCISKIKKKNKKIKVKNGESFFSMISSEMIVYIAELLCIK